MHIKRFEGATMADAVRKVREELGPEALILSTRTVRRDRGVFGRFGRGVVELTAAVDRDVRRGRSPDSKRRVGPDASWRDLLGTQALLEPLETELRALKGSVESLGAPLAAQGSLEEEARELRRLLADLRRESMGRSHDALTERLAGHLLAVGVVPRHAYDLAGEASREQGVGPDEAREALEDVLCRRFETRMQPPRIDRTDIVLYVGPTGVGKTTTLAKVAARVQEECRRLAVLSTDTQRLGAETQLRAFAKRMEIPFETAVSPTTLAQSARGLGKRTVLVDTAGRGRSDPSALGELARFRSALGKRARVHLVLSATTQDADLHAELARFRPLEPDALIVTKTDESASLGNIVNLLLEKEGPPLAWFADGQCVPEDLLVPDPREFARQVLGGNA